MQKFTGEMKDSVIEQALQMELEDDNARMSMKSLRQLYQETRSIISATPTNARYV